MKKRLAFLGLAVLALIALAIGFYLHSVRKPEAIKTTGIVEGTEVNLSAKISGRISYLCCREGGAIKEGEVAVRLENEDLKASVELARAGIEKAQGGIGVYQSMLENSKANVQSAQSEIKATNADVEKAKFQMELAKKEMDRSSELHNEGLISDDAYDVAVTKYNAAASDYAASVSKLDSSNSRAAAANAQLRTAENQLASAQADVKQAQANLAYNEARLADTTIASPINGTVVFISVEEGETVSPGVTIMTIVDMDHLYVRVDIEETLIGNLALGETAIVKIGENQVFNGKISEIGRYGEFATQKDVTRGRQDIRTFRVKITVGDSGGALKPGMTVGVEIPIKAAQANGE